MRLGQWIRVASSGVPLFLVALVADPVTAQFREVPPEGDSAQVVEIHLTPTKQEFVTPKLEPVPEGELEPTLAEGVGAEIPTPAVPAHAGTKTVTESQPVDDDGDELTSAPETKEAETAPTEPAAPAVKPASAFGAFHSPSSTGPEAPSPKVSARPLSFNHITPGQTSESTAKSQWGEPTDVMEDEFGKVLVYRAPGFQQVDLMLAEQGDAIESVLVHLTEPLQVEQLEEHLGLTQLRPVEITDASGSTLGRGYPERGVLLSYVEETENRLISHVLLEPIDGELYRLRAEKDHDKRFGASLADLEEATRLNPEDAKAFWLMAEMSSLVRRSANAWRSITVANRIEPNNPLYQLTRARLAAGNGDLTEALLFTKNVAESDSTPGAVKARAEYQWGNLVALGPVPDFQEALNHHLKAIDVATKHANDTHADVRRMAKDILVDAHLAIAQDVALGNFQRQREVVPKWLTRATELAEEFISSDQGDETIRMEIYRTTLAVYSVLEGNFDASIAAEEAIKEGQRLIASSQDRTYQFRVERELSEILYHAARVEHRCGRLPAALKYANNAVVLLEGEEEGLQPSLFDQIMSGQLYFLTGSIYAIQDEDHAEAVQWFERALPTFDDERFVNLVDRSSFGDLFVSMGVSYWESGDREKAIELTQAGAELMQEGVQTGTIQIGALSVPYGNLAAMHTQLGNGDKAKHFATMMAKIETDEQATRR